MLAAAAGAFAQHTQAAQGTAAAPAAAIAGIMIGMGFFMPVIYGNGLRRGVLSALPSTTSSHVGLAASRWRWNNRWLRRRSSVRVTPGALPLKNGFTRSNSSALQKRLSAFASLLAFLRLRERSDLQLRQPSGRFQGIPAAQDMLLFLVETGNERATPSHVGAARRYLGWLARFDDRTGLDDSGCIR